MDVENAARTNALFRRLCQIEDLRDRKEDWITAAYQVVPRFPKEDRQKIKTFISRRQKENAKKLLAFLEEARAGLRKMLDIPDVPAENPKKEEEIAAKAQWLGQLRTAMAQIDAVLAGFNVSAATNLLDYEWEILDKQEGE